MQFETFERWKREVDYFRSERALGRFSDEHLDRLLELIESIQEWWEVQLDEFADYYGDIDDVYAFTDGDVEINGGTNAKTITVVAENATPTQITDGRAE